MYEPIRGGTRGGQAEFKWSDVSADKDREHYLGHSINAPTGRWQKNKDVHWYSRDQKDDDAAAEELRRVKEAEAEAMSVALGFAPTKASSGSASSPTAGSPSTGTGANAVPVAPGISRGPAPDHVGAVTEDEEKRRRKEEKRAAKEEKRAHKAEKRAAKEERRSARQRNSSRSRSPRRRPANSRDASPFTSSRRRSRSPDRRLTRDPPRRRSGSREHVLHGDAFDESARDRDRERDRRRWEDNVRREAPGGSRWGRDR